MLRIHGDSFDNVAFSGETETDGNSYGRVMCSIGTLMNLEEDSSGKRKRNDSSDVPQEEQKRKYPELFQRNLHEVDDSVADTLNECMHSTKNDSDAANGTGKENSSSEMIDDLRERIILLQSTIESREIVMRGKEEECENLKIKVEYMEIESSNLRKDLLLKIDKINTLVTFVNASAEKIRDLENKVREGSSKKPTIEYIQTNSKENSSLNDEVKKLRSDKRTQAKQYNELCSI